MDNDAFHKMFQQAMQLHQTGHLATAQQIYLTLLEKDRKNSAILHLLGIVTAQQQNYVLSRTYLTQALAIDPHSPHFHNSMGNTLQHLHEFTAALRHYHIALQMQPDNAVLHNNIGIVQQKLKHLDLALQHYRQAIALTPNYADAHYNLSLCLLELEKKALETQEKIQEQEAHETVIQHLCTAVDLQPWHASAHCQLAQLYQLQNKHELAIKHYQKTTRIDKYNITAQHNLGGLLLQKNKFAAAILHLKKTIQLDPTHCEALYNLGVAFLLQRNPEAALKYFLHFLQITKNAQKDAKNYDAYYNLGVIYNLLGRINDAIVYFDIALNIKPDDCATHMNLGAIYLKQENYLQATKHYRAIQKQQPQNQEIAYILAGITQKINPNVNKQHTVSNADTDNTSNGDSANNTSNASCIPEIAPQEYVQHLFDDYATTYDKHLELLTYQAPQLLHDAVAKILQVATPTAKTITHTLDLGCGTGLCGNAMRHLTRKLTGIDLSANMLKVASQKNIYDELKLGSIEEILPLYHDIDLIVAADTFVYIGDLRNIFTLSYRTLRQDDKPYDQQYSEQHDGQSITKQNRYFAFTIEETSIYPYTLQPTLRFAHSTQYIEELAQQNNFNIVYQRRATIRKNRDTDITCLLYVLQKTS